MSGQSIIAYTFIELSSIETLLCAQTLDSFFFHFIIYHKLTNKRNIILRSVHAYGVRILFLPILSTDVHCLVQLRKMHAE